MRINTFLLFLILMIASHISYGQEVIDSLKNELEKPVHDTTRLALYFQIAEYYTEADRDSSQAYTSKGMALAKETIPDDIETPVKDSVLMRLILYKGKILYVKGDNLLNTGNFSEAVEYVLKSIETYEIINNIEGVGESYTLLGICQFVLGDYENSIDYFQRALEIFTEIEDYDRMASSYNNIGIIYRHQGLYDRAIENYMYSLRVYEEVGNTRGQGSANMNIGIVHNYQENFDLALEFYIRAVEIFEEIDNKRELNRLYNNIGIVYNNKANRVEDDEALKTEYYRKALDNYNKALAVATEMNDRLTISAIYSNIGSVYKDLGQYNIALDNFNKSLKIDKGMGDRGGMASVYARMCELYNILADEVRDGPDSQELLTQYRSKAIEYGEKSYKIALEIGSYPSQRASAQALINSYKNVGNNTKALFYAEKYIEVNEIIYNEDRARALTEMQTKYEAEKKELEIANLNKENALRVAELAQSEEQRKRQLVIIYSFIAGFIIIVIFSLIITRLFIQKKKANILLAQQKAQIQEKNVMLEEAMEEIRAQRDEIEAQHSLVVKQKDFIEMQKSRIDDSIRYAQRIQTAVLPSTECISSLFEEYFVLFQPKDVVSGDFYWITSSGDWAMVVAADCTGHGVPGAFMSMLGISFLNQISVKGDFNNAADVLCELREAVVMALKQSRSEDSQVDGMDISLAIINKKTLKCHWAGANNPLWIVRKDNREKGLSEPEEIVEEIKGDKMPIAIYVKMDKYQNHEVQLNKGDQLYLFSDGYVDQFGGLNQKKFNRREFRKLIANTASLPMSEQKDVLEKTFTEWKNPESGEEFDQIDDVVVLGIKI